MPSGAYKAVLKTLPTPHHQNSGRQIKIQLKECIIPIVTAQELQEKCGRIGDKAPDFNICLTEH